MTHTAKLAKLQQTAANERDAARELEAEAEAAKHAAAEARDALVEAHARGTDIRKAEKALGQARDRAEAAGIRAEAAARRVERAEQEAQTYEAEHVHELVAELEPHATAAAKRLTESAHALYEAHGEWHEVATKVNALLRHVPGAAQDVPGDHALASVARDLRNFTRQAREVAPPLPPVASKRAEEVAA